MGVAGRGVGPELVVTDGWTQRRELQGRQMDGGGKRLGGGGQWSEVIIRWEMGSELRRGEWRGKKKGEAALRDKGFKARGWAREGSGSGLRWGLPARLVAETDRLCS